MTRRCGPALSGLRAWAQRMGPRPRGRPARTLPPEGAGTGPLTFFFFFRITFTPSTETMMLTFFFLMFLALNSYCGREGTERRGQSRAPAGPWTDQGPG